MWDNTPVLVTGGASFIGSNLVVGVILIPLIECSGLVLLAVFVPWLARQLGTDARRALWLALLSPLVMLELMAAGHNDVMMAGLLVAGDYRSSLVLGFVRAGPDSPGATRPVS